ncbi:MAG TPA: flippase-like domain-containing protein [Candidatus Desulfofervidus auxilii]|uniref:Flippase-like domain-containing protein n=1 Tax=Desulfofervidus auxilii TaxID=1621989 RepID=A0A7V0IAG7_DESA2|nr:flippase-like domain-containing protein [Candidatus Desulfofervidus auxilii]
MIAFGTIKIKYVLICLFLSLIFPAFSALRWYYLLKASNQIISFPFCFVLTVGAWPLNVFLPSRGGDFFRVAFVESSVSKAKAFGSIIAEKLLDIICLCMIGFFGAISIKNKKFISIFLIMLILIGVSTPILSLLQRYIRNKNVSFLNKLDLILQGMDILSFHQKFTIFAAIWAFTNWILSVVQVFLFFKAFGAYVPPLEICTRLPLSIFAGVLPITLAGIGTRDAAMLFFFKGFASASIIFGVSILYTLSSYFLYSFLGIPFFIYLVNKRKG